MWLLVLKYTVWSCNSGSSCALPHHIVMLLLVLKYIPYDGLVIVDLLVLCLMIF